MQVRSMIVYIVPAHQIICICGIIAIWIWHERLLSTLQIVRHLYKTAFDGNSKSPTLFYFIYTKPHFLLVATRFYVAVILDGGECYNTRPKVLVVWWAYMRKNTSIMTFWVFIAFCFKKRVPYNMSRRYTHTHT